jgi:predicted outer membrane protein
MLIKNQGEIEMSRFGEANAKSDQVKDFARQLAEDHRQIAEKLQRLAGVRDDNRTAASMPGTDSSLGRLLEIDRQIVERCGELARQQLESKSGADFDWCFVGTQIGAHTQMLAALDVISQRTDGELQQIAQDAKAKVKDHLDQAIDLEKELSSKQGHDARQARSD